MRFFRDLSLCFVLELKRFYRWKERIVWDIAGAVVMFFAFILVWRAVLMGGFEGIGNLTRETYITFLLSGSIFWEIIMVNIGGNMGNAFVKDKYQKTLSYILISPLNKISYLYGKLGTALIRSLINTGAVLLIAVLFFDFTFEGSILLALGMAGLTFMAFSGFGLVIASLGAWREGFADFSIILTDILYLFSGVHYPIQVFPEGLRNAVSLLPTTQAIESIRAIGLHGAGFMDLLPQITYIGSLAILTPVFGYLIFRWVKNKAMLIGV